MLDKGILVYGKSPGDVARGKLHGSVDIGLSVISTKSKRKRLDIDAEEFIHHLKVSSAAISFHKVLRTFDFGRGFRFMLEVST